MEGILKKGEHRSMNIANKGPEQKGGSMDYYCVRIGVCFLFFVACSCFVDVVAVCFLLCNLSSVIWFRFLVESCCFLFFYLMIDFVVNAVCL